jgi:nicotinamidase-related amidase
MELLEAGRSVLVVVDLQGKLMEVIHRPRVVIEATRRLMKLAEMFEVPVLMTEQYPKGLGPTHPEVLAGFEALTTPKRSVPKTSFGCCGEPAFLKAMDELRPRLRQGPRQVVVAGIEAHVCVMQTVLELMHWGNQVHVAWDAVSGRGEEYRRHALERMAAAGAVLTNHESVGFEWARDKNHPRFRELSNLLKEGQPAG